MSTDDVSYKQVRLQTGKVVVTELCTTKWMRHGWEETHRDKKMYEYQAWQDEVRRHGLREIRYNWKHGMNRQRQKPKKPEQLDPSEDWDSIPEMIPCSFSALYPRTVTTCYHIDFPVHWSEPAAYYLVSIHTQAHLPTRAAKQACIPLIQTV